MFVAGIGHTIMATNVHAEEQYKWASCRVPWAKRPESAWLHRMVDLVIALDDALAGRPTPLWGNKRVGTVVVLKAIRKVCDAWLKRYGEE